MKTKAFPVIDPAATGENIARLRRQRGLSVRDLQSFFGFEEPQAIYKWQRGESLPTVDNLFALGSLLEVPLEQIHVRKDTPLKITEQPLRNGCSDHFLRAPGVQRASVRKIRPFRLAAELVRSLTANSLINLCDPAKVLSLRRIDRIMILWRVRS